METAFAAGEPPVGVSATMHTAALAWTPPGFTAFDTGRTVGDATEEATAAAGSSPAAEPEPAGPSADAATAPPDAPPASNGNGHATGPEAEPSDCDDADADRGDTAEADPDPAIAGGPDGIAGTGPVNARDAHPDPMEIPEFLRRVQ